MVFVAVFKPVKGKFYSVFFTNKSSKSVRKWGSRDDWSMILDYLGPVFQFIINCDILLALQAISLKYLNIMA